MSDLEANLQARRDQATLDEFDRLLASRAAQGKAGAAAAAPPAAAPAVPPHETERVGAISYGWQTGKHSVAQGAQDVVDGLNEIGGGDLRGRTRGAARVVSGLMKMGLSPFTALGSAVGDTLDKIAPSIARSSIASGDLAGRARAVLDPFGTIVLGLEQPKTDEEKRAFVQKAEAMRQGFTFREAAETAVAIAAAGAGLKAGKGTLGHLAQKGKAAAETAPKALGEGKSTAIAKKEPGGPPAKVGGEIEKATPEDVTSLTQSVESGETPVPEGGVTGPRIFGVNWKRLGADDATNRVILKVNQQLAEQGRMPQTEGALKPTTAEDVTRRAKDLGVTLDDVLGLPNIPERVTSIEQFDAFTAGVRGVRDVVLRNLAEEAKMAVAGDEIAKADIPVLLGIARQAAVADKLTGENFAQALAARRMPSDITTSGTGSVELAAFVERFGEMANADKAAAMISKITSPAARRTFIGQVGDAVATGKNILWELYVNSLLSGPATVVKKVVSDTLRAAWEIPERALGRMNHVLFFPGDDFGVAAGEAKALARGFATGIAAGMRAVTHKDVDLGTGLGESHAFPKALTAENVGVSPEGPLGRAINTMGDVVRTPGTAIGVATDVAKAASYIAEVAAQAVRQAHFEGLTGQRFADRVAYLQMHPTEMLHMHAAATEAALANTFTQEMGPAGQGLSTFLNAAHLRAQVPFLRIPWNITKFGVQTVFPFNVPSMLWGELSRAIRAGGASRELAIAQIEMGGAISAAVAYYVANQQITGVGPRDAGLREERRALGIPPYSIKVGDTWYRYNVVEPVGGMISLVADAVEIGSQLPAEGEWYERTGQVGATIALAMGRTAAEKPFFTGVKQIIEAIEKPDEAANILAKGWARSLVPALVRRGNQAYWDRTMREARGPLDALKSVTPGYSDTLPPHRNPITGTPVEFPPGLGPDIASPITYSEQKPDPVMKMLVDNQISVKPLPWTIDGRSHADPMIRMKESSPFDGIALTPAQRDRWVLLMTQEVRAHGQTLYDALSSLMARPRFQIASDGPRGGKDALVHEIVSHYREAARERLLAADPDLRAKLLTRTQDRIDLKWAPITSPRSPQFQGGALSIGR